jgi:predicted site-specific integrase-resolvase
MTIITSGTSPTKVGVDDRLRIREAAEQAHTSRATIYRWIEQGFFKSWVVKRRGFERGIHYIDKASFEAFLNSQKQEEEVLA